jgi:GDP/UDP-N,N'-diacetylbacillosamine 2-epimerase (hydrolysing)
MGKNKKRIAFFTTTRAEFGILLPFIQQVKLSDSYDYSLFAGGSHLAKEYGHTIDEITASGLTVSGIFDYLLNGTDTASLAKSLGIAVTELSDIFLKHNFDFICVLGDRYELLAIVSVAVLFKKPIIHLSGGESTEGTIDEQVRHMITKASHVHFTYSEECAANIRKMGEEPWRVFNVGALGVDNFTRKERLPRAEIFKILHLDARKPAVLFAFHPVAFEQTFKPKIQVEKIFAALKKFDLQVVITSPNAEADRQEIYDFLVAEAAHKRNYHFFNSLGEINFNSLLPHCEFIIGNSSSGIVYAPYFKVPTINVGSRQNGRIRHESIIDVNYDGKELISSIEKALDIELRKKLKKMTYKFGGGNSAELMIKALTSVSSRKDLLIKKMVFPGK